MEKRESSNQTFKVGDKVRILKTGAIEGIEAEEGTILEVVGVDVSDGTPYLLDIDGESCCTFEHELQYLEKVESKPTKNKRIKTLEEAQATLKEMVKQLKARVEQLGALVEAQQPKVKISGEAQKVAEEIAESLRQKLGEYVGQTTLTPNQRREAIIDEAKAFYTETLNEYQLSDGEVIVLRNDKERSISVTIRHIFSLKPLLHGKAKCAPDDVFNADIGKAIALGRALGLDVSKFEQADKPTEVVAGMVTVYPEKGTVATTTTPTKTRDGWWRDNGRNVETTELRILDDTGAEY